MAAYMIFIREGEIVDHAAMADYRQSNSSVAPADYDLEPLVVYGRMEALEGDAPDGIVVLRFPSVDAARKWYFSPGYQAALAHRQRAADYRVVLVEGR